LRFGQLKIIVPALVGILCSYTGVVVAQENRPPPGHIRSLTVPKTDVAPVIDGKLDEELWKNAAVADGFWNTLQSRWPAEKTDSLVTADKEHLYFGFRAYDSQPDRIEARQTRRDAGFGLDDQLTVELDPFHNHREISSYSVNAIGTQDDAIAGGRARNIQWKGDWRAAVAKTDYGWSAEIAIPFEILNYRDGDKTFGINFLRYHNRTDEWSRWADVTPQNKPEEMGQITGLELPAGVKTFEWTFMPYVLLGPLAGATADRVPRRAIMIAADLARAAIALSIPFYIAILHDPAESGWLWEGVDFHNYSACHVNTSDVFLLDSPDIPAFVGLLTQ